MNKRMMLDARPGEDEPDMATPRVSIETIERERAALGALQTQAGASSLLAVPVAPGTAPLYIGTNRLSTPDDYHGKKRIFGSGNDFASRPVSLCRAYWKEVSRVSIVSILTEQFPFLDSTGADPDHAQFAWAHLYLRIVWGDGNSLFTRDVSAGSTFEVDASFVEVFAFIYPRWPRNPTPYNHVPTTVSAEVEVMLADGSTTTKKKLFEQGSFSPQSFQNFDLPNIPQRPVQLYSMSGYQNLTTPIYVQLFDQSPAAATLAGPYPMSLQTGDSPLYQFILPPAKNFSLEFENGLMFQQGLKVAFSSTSGSFTPIGAATGGFQPSLDGGDFALNLEWELNTPFFTEFP